MILSPEHIEFMNDHKFAVLSTGRRDGSPQASMVGCVHDRGDILVVFRRSSAKYHNIARQPRLVLSVPDGRRVLTVYGDGVLVEKDPDRVEAFQSILTSYGMPESPHDELAASMDEEQRVILRIHPTAVTLHD